MHVYKSAENLILRSIKDKDNNNNNNNTKFIKRRNAIRRLYSTWCAQQASVKSKQWNYAFMPTSQKLWCSSGHVLLLQGGR